MVVYVINVVLLVSTLALLVAWLQSRRQCESLTEEMRRASDLAAEQQVSLQQRTQLDTLKDEFISTVSHELRTPLTSIRGALGLLSAGMLGKMDPKVQNLLRIASTNTDRLVRLINDILDLQRMDSGRAPLQVHRCSMPELEVQAVETMTAMAQAANVSLEIADEPSADLMLDAGAFDGDPDRILQVLCNLLSNAIKFSPPGAAVRIRSSVRGSDLLVTVHDAGRGIPADKLESIFDRFQQVDPSDSRQKGGTGLGLAICRSIATQHGGSIWAERNESPDTPALTGSTFTLRLPRLVEPVLRLPLGKPANGAVLVCDDDPGIRHVVAAQLRHHGYTVLEAENGEAAIHLAEQQHVEAILLDLYMPGLSGWETLERLKASAATAAIPVVILSVLSPSARTADGALGSAGAQGWVQKPFNDKLLLAELSRVLHPGGGPGHILLVEDDLDLATVVLSGFEQLAAEAGDELPVIVDHVSTLLEARQRCLTNPPDVLVLDLALPDGSGFTFVDWLRQQPSLTALPLVVYSGREVNEQEMEQLRLGPTQFLAKTRVQPQDVEELVLAMMRNLRLPPAPSSANTVLQQGSNP